MPSKYKNLSHPISTARTVEPHPLGYPHAVDYLPYTCRNANTDERRLKVTMTERIYYLTGMGGSLHKGLGEALLQRGVEVVGRELRGDFAKLDFGQKVETVSKDLQTLHLENDPRVVANSFGAYLLLHALADQPPFTGKLLILSPIVGNFSNVDVGIGFVPPRSKRLLEIAQSGRYPTPTNCQIHVGGEDWQCNPENVRAFGAAVNIPVHIVPKNGHMLERQYVAKLLDNFIS